jgi:hypothetical protein
LCRAREFFILFSMIRSRRFAVLLLLVGSISGSMMFLLLNESPFFAGLIEFKPEPIKTPCLFTYPPGAGACQGPDQCSPGCIASVVFDPKAPRCAEGQVCKGTSADNCGCVEVPCSERGLGLPCCRKDDDGNVLTNTDRGLGQECGQALCIDCGSKFCNVGEFARCAQCSDADCEDLKQECDDCKNEKKADCNGAGGACKRYDSCAKNVEKNKGTSKCTDYEGNPITTPMICDNGHCGYGGTGSGGTGKKSGGGGGGPAGGGGGGNGNGDGGGDGDGPGVGGDNGGGSGGSSKSRSGGIPVPVPTCIPKDNKPTLNAQCVNGCGEFSSQGYTCENLHQKIKTQGDAGKFCYVALVDTIIDGNKAKVWGSVCGKRALWGIGKINCFAK